MVRSSMKFVPWKDHKAATIDLKHIYQYATEEEALQAPEQYVECWGGNY